MKTMRNRPVRACACLEGNDGFCPIHGSITREPDELLHDARMMEAEMKERNEIIWPAPFRKKPVEIMAMPWTGENLREVIDFTGLHPSAEKWTWEEYEAVVARDGLKIFTLEGPMMASVGDWIIRGVAGEFYPCKPEIFEQTYEACAVMDRARLLLEKQGG